MRVQKMVVATVWMAAACFGAKPPSDKVDPHLTIRIYTFASMPSSDLRSAVAIAMLGLHESGIHLSWMDCTSAQNSVPCESPERPDILTIRIVRGVMPQARAGALGMAMRSVRGDSAVLFYDRASSLTRPGRYLDQILGRAMAHEIAHMLLPDGSHADFGLMREDWAAEDLRLGNPACFGFTKHTIALLRTGALRRAVAASVWQQNVHGDE